MSKLCYLAAMSLQADSPVRASSPIVDPRFPVGNFIRPEGVTPELVAEAVEDLAGLPGHLRSAIEGLDDAKLDTPYRDGGWTVRHLVHHIADSHINAYMRIKLALTEDLPTIKLYDEKAWAELPDSTAAIASSLELIESLHTRWVLLLRALSPEQWHRAYLRPDRPGVPVSVETTALIYAWHSRHHVAHITSLRARKGW
jgi:hypothetical protein